MTWLKAANAVYGDSSLCFSAQVPVSTNRHFAIVRNALLSLIVMLGVFVRSASAQGTTGLPPFSTVHPSAYDSVKINDGAVMLNLPVWTKPGLIPFSYSLVFNNAVGQTSNLYASIPNIWSAQTSVGFTPALKYAATGKQVNCPNNQQTTTKYTGFKVIDGYGGSHPLSQMVWDSTGCFTHVLSESTSDGSGLSLTVSSNLLTSTIRDRESNVFTAGNGLAPAMTDPNGNQLSYVGQGLPGTYICGGTETLTTTYTDTTLLSPMTETVTCVNSVITKDAHSWTDISGNTQSFTINYSQYTQKTSFGCYIPADIGPNAVQLPSSIATPEGNYMLTYESQSAGTVTGRLAKMVFPSGASVAYTYTGGSNNNGLTCQAQTSDSVPWYAVMVPVLTRTLTDVNGNVRTWKYDTTQATNETVVTDPGGNDTVYMFYTYTSPTNVTKGFYETQRQIFQGSHTATQPQLLKTVLTCYNGNATNCINPASLGGLIAQKDVYTTLAGMTQSSQSETKYDGSGNLLEDKEYDFSGSLISDRVLVYGSYSGGSCSAIGISDRVCSDTTSDSTHILAQSYYTYDPHGNRTQTSSLVSGSGNGTGTYINTSATYNSNGTVQYSYDTKQNKTSYTYGNCNSTLPTLVQEAMSLSRSMVWNCTGGVITSSTDANSQVTNYKYINSVGVIDPFWRLLEADYPDTGVKTATYNDAANPPNVVMSGLINSSGLAETTQTNFDGFGHPTQTSLTTDPQGTTYTVKAYDLLERLGTSYNPTRCNPPTTQCSGETTWGYSTYSYDALGRITQITQPDTSKVGTSYSGNCTTVTDEAGNRRESCADALGRIITVFEDPGTSPHLNYETDYSYDGIGNLLSITQKGGSTISNQWRTRVFQYDALSRLTSATNPESGYITYSYSLAAGALCAGDPKAVCTKTAPSPNQTGASTVTTTYTYDALNRLIGKGYVDSYGSNPPTASVSYGYDGVALTGCTIVPPSDTDSYPVGRNTAMCDGSGGTSWIHDKMGRVKQERRSIGAAAVSHYIDYTYNLDGSLSVLQTPPMKQLNYTYNGAGRATKLLDSTDSINFVTNGLYAPTGELTGMTLGSATGFAGFTTNNAYSDRLQPILLSASSPTATVFSECFDFHLGLAITAPTPCSFPAYGSGNNGNVYQIVNTRDNTRTENYTYDVLNRIASGQSSGTQWGETFTIDAWGNLTNETGIPGKTISEGLNTSAGTNNQLAGFGYDAAGNMSSNGSTTYVYDAENRLVWTSGLNPTPTRYSYDGNGARVEKCAASSATTPCPTSGTTGTIYWRGTSSDTLAETDLGGNDQEEYIFFNGQRIARRDTTSTGTTIAIHYYFSDHLGSHGVVENATGSSCEQDIDYYPYGGVEHDYCPNVAQNYKFTAKERDAESGLDNFEARYLGSSLGRFMSPDPMGGKTEDPQSLNRYAYVRNNPLTFTDPSGMNFGLPCSGGNTDTCNNGLQGSWQHDDQGNKTTFTDVSIGNKDGTLQDVSSNKTGTYTASFDGSNVSLTNSGGTTQNGSWLQGTDAVSGVSGGGNLSSKFDFTFSDHGNGQSLNATFTYAGKFSEAQSELYKAGYSFSALDQMFNVREMFANPNAENYRTPGAPDTGANSGHFLVNHSILSLLPKYSVPTTGSVHTGETNPWASFGAAKQHLEHEQ